MTIDLTGMLEILKERVIEREFKPFHGRSLVHIGAHIDTMPHLTAEQKQNFHDRIQEIMNMLCDRRRHRFTARGRRIPWA